MDFLKLLSKKLNGKYDYLKILKVVYNTTFSLCHINFIYPENIPILTDYQKQEIIDATREVLGIKSKLDCKFNKSYLDEKIVKNKIAEFLNSDFNSISSCIENNMIKYKKDNFSVELNFFINETLKQYFADNNVCEKVKGYLQENFCGDFIIKFTLDNSNNFTKINLEQRAIEVQSTLQVNTKNSRYKVQNLIPVFGCDIAPLPQFIKDITGEKNVVVLAGTVSNLEDKEYLPRKNKEKGIDEKRKMYKFKLTDDSGSINVIHFCNKKTEKHFCLIEEGSHILCLGDVSKRGNDLQYMIKAVSLCSKCEEKVHEEEQEQNVVISSTYKYVTPTKYTRTIQDNLFDIKEEYPDFIKNNSFVVFDVETTGLLPDKCDITEIGAVKIVNGEITECFQSLCKPHSKISDEITRITGITNEMVENECSPEEIIEDFLLFCGDSIMVGYNVNFDYQFIQLTAQRINRVFENEFRDCMGDAKAKLFLPNYKLSTVVSHLGVTLNNAHRALFDATATAEVFLKLSLM